MIEHEYARRIEQLPHCIRQLMAHDATLYGVLVQHLSAETWNLTDALAAAIVALCESKARLFGLAADLARRLPPELPPGMLAEIRTKRW